MMMKKQQAGSLILADGTVFNGISVGYDGLVCGEVVFNTAQTGYQEILTDPSYKEQIIVFTQPHIGNVGVNAADMESERVHAKGAIMRSFSKVASNWRAEKTLADFLQEQQMVAISEIDTRALTQHLRQFGSQAGCLMGGQVDVVVGLQQARAYGGLLGQDLAQTVTTEQIYTLGQNDESTFHVVVVDFGVKRSILNCLIARDCKVTVVPSASTSETILALKPDGIVLSNGPGDPAACDDAIHTTRTLLKQGLPIMAICLGHQILALASGGHTEKMTFGHHGANHPIQSVATGIVAISSQNHGFVVAEKSLPACLRVTHRSLFDGTIAGIERIDVPAFGFQGHPEAGPGPTELTALFDHFISLLEVDHAQAN